MKFTYTAMDKAGKRLHGTIEAANEKSAKSSLQSKGLKPLGVKKVSGSILSKLTSPTSSKVKLKDTMLFTRQLATMINAGVPLVRSLATLQSQTENPAFRNHINAITKDVESGIAFADALEKHPKVFSPIYVNMVRAGEAGGILDDILKKLATQQEKDSRIRQKFKSAMTYPIILLSITFITFIGLMVVVVPKLGKIIQELAGPETQLPALTRSLLAISDFMIDRWYIVIGATLLTLYLLRRYVRTPGGRYNKDKLLLRMPIIGVVIKKVAIARFSRIFASMLGAGVSVVESINITGKALGNAVIEEELIAASKAVINGQQLSVPLSQSTVFPAIVAQMMAVGEETGQTDEILVKVAEFYEDEVDAVVESISSILEPIMIVIMGGMVGLIAAAVIGPISSLTSQV